MYGFYEFFHGKKVYLYLASGLNSLYKNTGFISRTQQKSPLHFHLWQSAMG
jgi:hypothetical protein